MSWSESLPYDATLERYRAQAQTLFEALGTADDSAAWRVKWEHPRFRGKSVGEVRAATLELADAQVVVAREYGFDGWTDLEAFSSIAARNLTPRGARFEVHLPVMPDEVTHAACVALRVPARRPR